MVVLKVEDRAIKVVRGNHSRCCDLPVDEQSQYTGKGVEAGSDVGPLVHADERCGEGALGSWRSEASTRKKGVFVCIYAHTRERERKKVCVLCYSFFPTPFDRYLQSNELHFKLGRVEGKASRKNADFPDATLLWWDGLVTDGGVGWRRFAVEAWMSE